MSKVRDRIMKLLNVAKNDAATQGEIDNAIRMAKTMMDQYHLSESDLVQAECIYTQAKDAVKGSMNAFIGRKGFYWERSLAVFVEKFVGGIGCYIGETSNLGRKIVFYGIHEDAQLAAELYNELRLTIITLATAKYGGAYKNEGGSYSEGFVKGLFDKIKPQPVLSYNRGLIESRNKLIEYKKSLADQWLSEQQIRVKKRQQKSGRKYKMNAWQDGKKDGFESEVSLDRNQKIGYE